MGGAPLLGKDRDLSGPRKAQQFKVRQLSWGGKGIASIQPQVVKEMAPVLSQVPTQI